MTRKLDYDTVTPDQLRAASVLARTRFFDTATEAQIARVTEPCIGEAHRNGNIDCCAVCLGAKWGRSLKSGKKQEDL